MEKNIPKTNIAFSNTMRDINWKVFHEVQVSKITTERCFKIYSGMQKQQCSLQKRLCNL